MGIDVTAFGLPILLISGNTLYPISFLVGFFPPSLSLSLYYEVNRKGRPKAVTSFPIFLSALNTATDNYSIGKSEGFTVL